MNNTRQRQITQNLNDLTQRELNQVEREEVAVVMRQNNKKQSPKKQSPKKQSPKKQSPKKQSPKKQSPKKQSSKKSKVRKIWNKLFGKKSLKKKKN